ncbi:MAG TPA: LPS-assembly protein LptD, partial [Thiotrichales bacterium]|nr:LPS-assembly protein LptD [Thiotrichales bacterium]
DHADEYGRAHGVVMRFKDVPFLYTPYIEFPTSDRRRSGLLFPEFGTSSSRGFEFAQPWYWNIAPNMDAVITPRYMNRRGTELGGEYRYLTSSTTGNLQGSYLDRDKITEENRYQVRYQQHTRLLSGLQLNADWQDISDKDYFNDFSNNLGTTSQTHLNRSADLQYDTTNWHMRMKAQKLKTIDTDSPLSTRPYARLPQLTLNGENPLGDSGLLFTLDAELVDFAHEDNSKTTGSRISLRPGLRWPFSGAAWYVDPAVRFSHTQYDVGSESGGEQSIDNRNLPMSSIDAGLFFERQLDNGLQQTLEPRLYYLNVPFEEQNAIPLFDTSTPDFSVAQLFRDNRFNGGDRIGDANQLTLALSSRLLDPQSGNERLRASIGQIFYFRDRRISLDGTTDTARQSDIIAELDTRLGRWSSNFDIQWDTRYSTLSKQNYFLHYQSDDRHVFNIGYRKRLLDNRLDIEQTDISFVAPLGARFSAYARWNYSLKDEQHIDAIGGFSYDSCCWSIQLLA